MARLDEPQARVRPVTHTVPDGIERPTRARYVILGITFVIAFIMYIDRAVVGTATPAIMQEFGLTKISMGWTTSAFNWTYALLQVPGGWMADRFGPRIVLTGAMVWWSLFTVATGLSSGVASLTAARALFGAGEAAAFPSASRALVPWLPEWQRAFGQGFQHAGSRFGAAVAPTLVVLMMSYFNWRTVFYVLGVFGILWAGVWYWYYRNTPLSHAGTNAAERDLLPVTPSVTRAAVPWRAILTSHDVWALSAMYFCYGWVLWVYLQWLPTYLAEARNFSGLRVGFAASLPLLVATGTNALGGWLSDTLTARYGRRRGRISVSVAGFLVAAAALVPGVLAHDTGTALACLVVAMGGLELTVAVSWAISIDLGRHFSGSVSGVMNTWGNLGGAASAVAVGYLATLYGWTLPFITASGLCLVAAGLACFIDPTRETWQPTVDRGVGSPVH